MGGRRVIITIQREHGGSWWPTSWRKSARKKIYLFYLRNVDLPGRKWGIWRSIILFSYNLGLENIDTRRIFRCRIYFVYFFLISVFYHFFSSFPVFILLSFSCLALSSWINCTLVLQGLECLIRSTLTVAWTVSTPDRESDVTLLTTVSVNYFLTNDQKPNLM